MKSLCIKTNNKNIINYLLTSIENINFDDIHFSCKNFKIYNNVIIHYVGNNICEFYNKISDIICDAIIKFYEPILIKKLINFNYFYFSTFERNEILNVCLNSLNYEDDFIVRKDLLYTSILKYISYNKSFVFDGFVNFRILEYMKILDESVDFSVNKFLIEKEYSEFINLLKLYINSQNSKMESLHLIYMNSESILLDDHKNLISINDNLFNAKYLCDISFSSNDYALNTILNILPENLYIHLIDLEDEFINTLKLIFEDRVKICKDCNICKTYKMINNRTKADFF